MKKEDRFNEEINPDGISNPLENLTEHVWDRGYYLETDDGYWYEVYVNDDIKKYYPTIDLRKFFLCSLKNRIMFPMVILVRL